MPFVPALLTWRECVVGMKPVESVQMELRRTWEVRPKNVPNSPLNAVNGKVENMGGGVNSETLGFVRWRMSNATMFEKPCRLLRSESYDQKAHVLLTEEVWATEAGDILRQREERTTEAGRDVAEAVFWPDRIELTRIDAQRRSTFSEVNPAGGMEAVQNRFKPMAGDRKEFLRLDALAGTFHKVRVERTGRFKGTWGGDAYDGASYRFTVDGLAPTTLMITPQNEVVQVGFDDQTSLVLAGPTPSRRKAGFGMVSKEFAMASRGSR